MIYMPELHQHLLAYHDNNYYGSTCNKCTQLIHAGLSFRCVQCKFGVHDYCLPLLPPTVKTKWHRHPLTLTHGPIKSDPDGGEGDRDEGHSDAGDRDEGHPDEGHSDESNFFEVDSCDRNKGEKIDFYCDCCEEKRDLNDPTYYCAKCHLISHVRCVMWEVMAYLQEKSTKVGELCNTKVIVIGEAKAIDNIYAAGNKDRMEQGDHQDIMDEESDHILFGLRNKIAAVSAKLVEHKANLEEYQNIYAMTCLELEELEVRLSERLSERLYERIAYKIEFK